VIYAVRVTAHNCDKTPWDNPTVLKAAELAFDTVWDTDCVRSESLKEEVLRKFDGLHIWCHQDNDKDTPCGSSRRFFGQQMNINLYQPALWDHRNCGPLASTVLHEVVHTTEWNIFQGEGVRADGCEKSCFDFGDGDADKCQ